MQMHDLFQYKNRFILQQEATQSVKRVRRNQDRQEEEKAIN